MKKMLVLLTVFVLVSSSLTALAEGGVEYGKVKIVVNGETIPFDGECILSGGEVYVPVSSFVGALGGGAGYDAAESTLTIVFEAEAAEEGGAAPAYTDAEIEAVLPTGRWSRVSEAGTSFFDFSGDHTGKVTGVVVCVWRVENGNVVVDYNAQGKDWQKVFRFEKSEESTKLVDVDSGWEYTLEGAVDPLVDVMGTWKVADGSVTLEVAGDGTFRLDVGGAVYAGTWAVQEDKIYLTQNGIAIQGKFGKDSLVLNIGGTEFVFGR